MNPPLVEKFKAYRLKFAENMEWSETKPILGNICHYALLIIILAFHGTAETNIDNIVKNNFDFSRIGASTGNMGYYGKGNDDS